MRMVRYILILFGLLALALATSSDAMEYIWAKRRGDKWWNADSWLNGNLVGMAHLDFVKKFISPVMHPVAMPANNTGTKNAVLYLYGDSYAWGLKDIQFAGLAGYHYVNRYTGGRYRLDTTKKNILIIEIGERLVRDYFKDAHMIDEFRDSTGDVRNIGGVALQHAQVNYAGLSLPSLQGLLFNKRISQNLERLLFNFNCIMPLFQSKAAINYYCFNRASGDVVISSDRNFLFDKGSIAAEGSGAYAPVPDQEIEHIAANLNTIYRHFRTCGFREVYLSIIPSTPSVVAPDGYNKLIPRIQGARALEIKVIDAYTALNDAKGEYFFRGDTHWTEIGEQKWVNMVNEILMQNQF